jgi:hypothetical protein
MDLNLEIQNLIKKYEHRAKLANDEMKDLINENREKTCNFNCNGAIKRHLLEVAKDLQYLSDKLSHASDNTKQSATRSNKKTGFENKT